jgi:hypothetical protein
MGGCLQKKGGGKNHYVCWLFGLHQFTHRKPGCEIQQTPKAELAQTLHAEVVQNKRPQNAAPGGN